MTIRFSGVQSKSGVHPGQISEKAVTWWYQALPPDARNEVVLVVEEKPYTGKELYQQAKQGTELGKKFLAWLQEYYRKSPHTYRLLRNGEPFPSVVPGLYAGYRKGKIFGTLSCRSGMRMKPENRVFFLTYSDAVREGYRPCKNCKPLRTPFD